MQTGRGSRRRGCNKFVIFRIPGWREIPSRKPGTQLCAWTASAPASGGDSTIACGMRRSRISCACPSGSAQLLCRTAGRTDAPRHPEISVRFVPSCFPLMLHLAAKSLCFLRKAGKNALKMTWFSRIIFIGHIGGKRSLRLLLSSFIANKITQIYRKFERKYLILSLFYLFPAEIQVFLSSSRFAAFVLRRNRLTPRAVKFAVLHV